MRKTPNLVSGMNLFEDAARLNARTVLVSAGSIIPSSHNLENVESLTELFGIK